MKTIPSFKDFLESKNLTKANEKQMVTLPEEFASVVKNSQVQPEDIKGFEKLELCKLSIEKSKKSLEKLKTLITNGVRDKAVMENYIKLLENRNFLIIEYNKLIQEKKKSLNK
jgi:hypothetical protein